MADTFKDKNRRSDRLNNVQHERKHKIQHERESSRDDDTRLFYGKTKLKIR